MAYEERRLDTAFDTLAQDDSWSHSMYKMIVPMLLFASRISSNLHK